MNATPQFWRDPALPYVESRRACHSRACYRPHSHPTFSIGAVDHGTSVFTGASDGPFTLHPGAMVFVPPVRVHACNPERGHAWSYQMLHLDAQWLMTLRQEEALQPNRPAATPIRVSREPSIYVRFCRLNELLFSDASVHEKEAALIEFVGDCHNAPAQPIAAPADALEYRQGLRRVLDMLCNERTNTLSINELAQMAGMSRYQLIRAFRAATGLTPHAWQLNQRVNQAREQLQVGKDLAEIAYCLGFADQSHFQRTFKAYAGVTPGRYRV
jgi:AraC-like DNA-binding protein